MYYNTNNETGPTLKSSRLKAETQKDKVLKFFELNMKCMSADQVWGFLFDKSVPVTSIRRAVTDLSTDGYLVKTEHMVDGMYGKKVHLYRLINK